MAVERLTDVKSVAEFLGAPEGEVMQLLEENRLGGTLVATLRRRGVPVTPRVKNSVGTVVRALSPVHGGAEAGRHEAPLAGSESTVTIMFTDIVGSTAITDRLGDRHARVVLGANNRIVRRQTGFYGGSEVKSMGDGFMLTFPSAHRGVGCAVAVQRELAEHNKQLPEASLSVRIGLSVGEPVREDRDLFGKSVILAARISSKAQGQQILISQIVYALVASTKEFTFREMGAPELKGISGTQPLYEVLWRQ